MILRNAFSDLFGLLSTVEARVVSTQDVADFQPAVLETFGETLKEPTGFPDKTTSVISFDDATRTFSISPVGASFDYYEAGVKHTVTATESVTIPNVAGVYFIYFLNGTLQHDLAPPDLSIFRDVAMVAAIQWSSTLGKAVIVGEERHGLMPWQVHMYLHNTQGCRFGKGFSVTYTENGTGNLNSDIQIALAGGEIWDEDLNHVITHSATPVAGNMQQVLEGLAKLPIYYRSGSTGEWVRENATDYPLKKGTTYPVYNYYNGSTWADVEVSNNDYFSVWIIATNDINEPVISVLGQHKSSSLSAQLSAETLLSMSFGSFPTAEFRMLYRITFRARSIYSNFMKTRIEDVTDFRTVTGPSSNGVTVQSVTMHNNMPGRDVAFTHPAGTIEIDPITGSSSTNVQSELERLNKLTPTSILPAEILPNYRIGPLGVSTTTPGGITRDTLAYVPVYVSKLLTATKISARCSTYVSLASVKLGIYADNNHHPGTLLSESTISVGAQGLVEATISVELQPGLYWLAFVTDSSANSYTCVSAVDGSMGRSSASSTFAAVTGFYRAFVYNALPADDSISTLSVSSATGTIPVVLIG